MLTIPNLLDELIPGLMSYIGDPASISSVRQTSKSLLRFSRAQESHIIALTASAKVVMADYLAKNPELNDYQKSHLVSDVTALDISDDALKTANENAKLNNVKVEFKKLNILSEDETKRLGVFELIVSNPPYISEKEKSTMHDRTIQISRHSHA